MNLENELNLVGGAGLGLKGIKVGSRSMGGCEGEGEGAAAAAYCGGE
jgi:hypothetical protein